ncbi:MAG: UDP-N-acetylmuramate--L-alanine ligase, partial [Deltaproteobacteria bacterium]|nr:UDP-N-acetylmuramate--L-alanine ligase [Deltaproteobacteria bacterium]
MPGRTTTERANAPRLDELDSTKTVHLAGVGGSGMCGVAALLRARGIPVVGTDPNPDDAVRMRLENAGVEVHELQDGTHIRIDTQLIVASAALPLDHQELAAARARGIPVVRYAELLGSIVNCADGIAVAGTHGKTTTTAMIVWALKHAGRDPGFIVGGHVPQLDASAGAGGSRIFVAEACEYDRSFLNLEPLRAIINNVGADHLDIYGDLAGVQEAFAAFAARVRPEGTLVHPADDEAVTPVVAQAKCKSLSFATTAAADYEARGIRANGDRLTFDLAFHGRMAGEIALRVPGEHNVRNALAALAICTDLGLAIDEVVPGLESFAGVDRRFELRGEAGGITVIDDYAHHPTEIRALLEGAAIRFPEQRLVVVFQPHQISRTRLLADELARAFDRADLLVVTDIYAARDKGARAADFSSADLVTRIAKTGQPVKHAAGIPTALELLEAHTRPGDV